MTSIFIGRFGGCQLSGFSVVDGEFLFERFLFAVRSGEAVLERGCPHWDMKERTRLRGMLCDLPQQLFGLREADEYGERDCRRFGSGEWVLLEICMTPGMP